MKISKGLFALSVIIAVFTGCSIQKSEGKRVRIDQGNGLYQIDKYDEMDRLVRYEAYSDDELVYYTVISYDENNRETATQTCNADDTVNMRTETEYDENGTAYTTAYDKDDNIMYKTVHEYYDNGNIRRYEFHSTDKEEYFVIEYSREGEEISSAWHEYETGDEK